MKAQPLRPKAERWLAAAIAAVGGESAVARHITVGPEGTLEIAGRTVPDSAAVVVAAIGKAAAAMARAAERSLGPRLRGGLVLTKDAHGLPLARLALREAGHPVPDARGERAAREILALATAMEPQDVFLLLLSGGASALSACPAEGLTLSDLATVTEALLAGGVEIREMNALRKHLSAFSGGRLAAAVGARQSFVLAISDVRGDPLDAIGSGPCEGDPSTFAEALAIAQRPSVAGRMPGRVLRHLLAGAAGERSESPKPGDPRLGRVATTIVAANADARRAAVEAARRDGFDAVDLGEGLVGEARELGRRLAELTLCLRSRQPVCLVAGGETTVTLRGDGRGGRSQELALAAAVALDERAATGELGLLAVGTDGSDGPTDAAGAWVDAETLARGRALGLDARGSLARNDAYGYLDREGGLLRTGPTHTNVMDLVLLVCSPARS